MHIRFHIVEDYLEDVGEVCGAAERGALQGFLVELEHSSHALNNGVGLPWKVEAVTNSSAPCEARYSSETKESEFPLESIGLQNWPYWLDGLFVVVESPIRVLLVERVLIINLTIWSSEIYRYWHVDVPSTS